MIEDIKKFERDAYNGLYRNIASLIPLMNDVVEKVVNLSYNVEGYEFYESEYKFKYTDEHYRPSSKKYETEEHSENFYINMNMDGEVFFCMYENECEIYYHMEDGHVIMDTIYVCNQLLFDKRDDGDYNIHDKAFDFSLEEGIYLFRSLYYSMIGFNESFDKKTLNVELHKYKEQTVVDFHDEQNNHEVWEAYAN